MGKKRVHIELLRIICILLVVFNHTGSRGFFLFAERENSIFYFPLMFLSVLCKVAVPVFFMISGALILPKQESISELFRKRIFRMLVVLAVVSIPYYLWLHQENGIGPIPFLKFIYSHNATTALWYLYSYLGVLFMLPFLRGMIRGLSSKEYQYLFLGHIVLCGVLPCASYLIFKEDISINPDFSAFIFVENSVFFVLLGHYVENVLPKDKWTTGKLGTIVIASIVGIMISCIMTWYRSRCMGICNSSVSQTFFNCFISLPAVGLYVLCRKLMERIRSMRFRRMICCIGETVFGTYLFEKFFRAVTERVFLSIHSDLGVFAAVILWCFATVGLGVCTIFLLKRVPFVSKILNRFI